MTSLEPAVADDRNRLDLAASVIADLARILDAVAQGPAGRHLRHCRGADGRPLFAWATAGNAEVVYAPHLLELLNALRSARPAEVCPSCRGEKCDDCRHAGYLPRAATLLAGEPVAAEKPTADVSVFWSETPVV